jgi:HEAT repeat protein
MRKTMKRLLTIIVGLVVCALLSGTTQAQQGKFLGKSADLWQKELSSKDAKDRASAAFALGKIGSDAADALPALVKLLQQDKEATVRDAVALAIGNIAKRGLASVEVISALCTALTKDTDYAVKRSAAVALGHSAFDTPDVRSALEKALVDEPKDARNKDKAKGLKQNAVWALGEVCERADKPPVASFRKALADGDKLVMRDAANAVAKLQAKTAAKAVVPELVACVKHDYVELRKSACFALVELVTPKDEQALDVLAKVCNNNQEDEEVRENAALALSNIGGDKAKAAVKPLLAMLAKDPSANANADEKLRILEKKRRAALAFRNLGVVAQEAEGELIRALKHPDEDLRHNAAIALGGIKSRAAVAPLVQRIADQKEKERVRVAACVALQGIGACDEAKAAVPQLIAVLDNPKQPPFVRERILWSLRVHQAGLLDYDNLMTAMKNILVEPGLKTAVSTTGHSSGKMLRYDCAFLLSVLKRTQAPEEVFPVLEEFVHDDKIRVFTGLGGAGGGVKGEGTSGAKGKVQELGDSDGRIMALNALGELGFDRVRTHPEILNQLKKMSTGKNFDDDIRDKAAKLLSDWGVK